MADELRVILEVGRKRRVVAGAMKRVSRELQTGARSAGRSREQFIRHVVTNEPGQFSRKVEDHAWEMEDRDPASGSA